MAGRQARSMATAWSTWRGRYSPLARPAPPPRMRSVSPRTADTRVAFSASASRGEQRRRPSIIPVRLMRWAGLSLPLAARTGDARPRLVGMLAAATPPDVMALGRSDDVTTLLRCSHQRQRDRRRPADQLVGSSPHRPILHHATAPCRRLRCCTATARCRSGTGRPGRVRSRQLVGLAACRRSAPASSPARCRPRPAAAKPRKHPRYGPWQAGTAADGIEARLGRLSESGRFLGSKPEGGYALARATGPLTCGFRLRAG